MKSKDIINLELIDIYKELKEVVFPNELLTDLSAPILLKVGDNWSTATERILIIGQETQGWGHDGLGYSHYYDFIYRDDSIQEMMEFYELFCFAKNSSHRKSPFWRAFRQIAGKSIDEMTINSNVLWTNLIRADYKRASLLSSSENDRNIVLDGLKGLLLKEINVLQPTKVIFFTGPRYDRVLKIEFPDVTFSKYSDDLSISKLAKIIIDDSLISLRTYHPAYIQRSKQWNIIDENICKHYLMT